MLRKAFLYFFLLLLVAPCSTALHAQPLFSYGTYQVSSQEFLKAFVRNNAEANVTDKTLREYLELYIRFKLKVRAALDARIDTSRQQQEEVAGFRSQILERYMTDTELLDSLVQEAMQRSKREIRLYHIFLSIPPGTSPLEQKAITAKADSLYAQLRKQDDFERLALRYSQDPAVVRNKGRIGYVTAFVLPYALENIVFKLSEGGISLPYRSNIGIHIFKHGGERVVAGQPKIAHILFAFPPDADKVQEEQTRNLADSVYRALQQGADFKEMAFQYSKDNITYLAGGEISDFSTGQYDADFEDAALALAQDGAISAPVRTAYGYHIIQRLGIKPVENDIDNPVHRDNFRQRVMEDDRNKLAKDRFTKKVLREIGYKKQDISPGVLTQIFDSVKRGGTPSLPSPLTQQTILFSFASGKAFTLGDWMAYLQLARENQGVSAGASADEWMRRYTETAALTFYGERLEKYNAEFAAQLNEFREGNLLFEVMQKKIWDVAAADTAGLKKHYKAHASKYWWAPSAEVVILTSTDETLPEQFRRDAQQGGFDWKKWVEQHNGAVVADSGRFELAQLPVNEGTTIVNGLTTSPMKNEIDNNFIFCYIVRMYPDKEPRNFTDARGFVVNDYQDYLEELWIAGLKKKYPVKVNEAVLRSLAQPTIK